MTDLLSSGPDTPGRRGTKVVVALLCLLALTALVIEHAGGKSHHGGGTVLPMKPLTSPLIRRV